MIFVERDAGCSRVRCRLNIIRAAFLGRFLLSELGIYEAESMYQRIISFARFCFFFGVAVRLELTRGILFDRALEFMNILVVNI